MPSPLPLDSSQFSLLCVSPAMQSPIETNSPIAFVAHPLSSEDSVIHERATLAARRFRQSEAELMEALIAVSETRLYLRMGFPSLFRYATELLMLSEAVAYCAISVARRAAEVPALREAVGSSELGLSKAKKILSVLKVSDSSDVHAGWVEKAVHLTSRRLERAVASENPMAATTERVVYRSARRVELTLGVGEELLLELRQAQNLVSTGRGSAVGLEGTLGEVVRFYLERKDPERRAKRVTAKKGLVSDSTRVTHFDRRPESDKFPAPAKTPLVTEAERLVGGKGAMKTKQFPGTVSNAKIGSHPTANHGRVKREPISAGIAHQLRLRDRNSCQAPMPNGKPCASKRWVEIHHRRPVSEGGGNSLENLVIFCRAHHQTHHQKGGQ